MSTTLSAVITPEQVAFYKAQGYLLPEKPMLPAAKFDRLKAIFEDMWLHRRELGEAGMDTPHFNDPRLLEFLLAEEVLDVIEAIIGPNIGLWSSHFIAKEPFTGKRTPWHEDSAYWKGRFDSFHGIVTVWMAIDDVDLANGCMKVVPGTHNNGFSHYRPVPEDANLFGGEIVLDNVDEAKAVPFERKAGQYSLHDSRIQHGADPNTSPRRRAGYTMRYFSLDMKLDPSHPGNATHKIWHARGKNVANNPLIHA